MICPVCGEEIGYKTEGSLFHYRYIDASGKKRTECAEKLREVLNEKVAKIIEKRKEGWDIE